MTPIPAKPQSLQEYADWTWTTLGLEVAPLEDQYERVASAMKRQFLGGAFWEALLKLLPELASRYYVATGFQMAGAVEPELAEKPWASFWLKTYRRNVIENVRWPRAPKGGWLTPEKWHAQVGDVIRTRIVVRYLDAIQSVVNEIETLARDCRLGCKTSLEATREGYYAAHVSVTGRFEVPRITFDTEFVRAPVEIQVTTQVKDVIQELLHKYYEDRRRQANPEPVSWEWDYMSDEFRSSYLGHLAHHMEGLIMELREQEKP